MGYFGLSVPDFSVANDANKGNVQMFPVCVRYFSVSDCAVHLHFIKIANETANGMHQVCDELSGKALTGYRTHHSLCSR